MADTKISALSASTTPLAGTEVLPIVQSSTTKQVSIANLTAGRAVSAASLALTTSPLPATSGGTGSNSAFTANGVAYASSTSALATGSTFVFDGTNLGIGVTLPTSKLHVSNASASSNAIAQFTNGTTGTGAGNGLYVGIDSTNTATIFNFYNSALQFGTNGTPKMTLDTSGNLLVGTTSTTGIANNSTETVGGLFKTINGNTGALATGASANCFTATAGYVYLVMSTVSYWGAVPGGNFAQFSGMSFVAYDVNGNGSVTKVSGPLQITFSFSGSTVQVTCNANGPMTIAWSAIRLV